MNEQILQLMAPARRSRHFETERTYRFLFPGGTSELAGAEAAFEAFRRAFGASDDVALIVACRSAEEPRIDWLAELFSAEDAPEVEFLQAPLDDARLPAVLGDVDALLYPWAAAPDRVLLDQAVKAELPMILPEDGIALDLFGHEAAYLAPCRAIEIAAGDGRLNRVDPQDLAGLLRQVPAEPDHARARALRAKRAREGRAEPEGGIDFPICWSGAALDYSGYAKTSRNFIPALLHLGVDVAFHSFAPDERFVAAMLTRPEMTRTWRHILERRPRGGLQVIFHPPYRTRGVSFLGHLRVSCPDFEAQVAFTMFETDRLPAGWADQLNVMDEVWVPSEFNVETFVRSGVERRKMRVVPLGIDSEPFANPTDVYEIPGRRGFNFLSIFDWTLRKGWDVLIDAWLRAFSAADDVSLTIRAYRAIKDQPPIREQIEGRIRALGIDPAEAPEIILIEDFVCDEDMPALFAAADAFVLPTRGEGWGMPLIEAMASGLPTIATRWSAQLEFMNDDNSWLIDVPALSPVDPEQTRLNSFYESDHLWAEPDPDHLVAIMREIVADPAAARAKGARAQAEIAARFSADEAARILRDHAAAVVERVRAERLTRGREPKLPEVLPNIAWTGPIYDSSGYADEGRAFVLGLLDQETPVRLFPLLWAEKQAAIDPVDRARFEAAEEGPFVPDRPVVMIQHALGLVVEPHPKATASIARTMFETDSLPREWVDSLLAMDAVFVPSEFNRRTFAAAGIPAEMIEVVPGSIDTDLYRRPARPIDLGSKRGFNFLSVFDWTRRKGWDVLLRAYLAEFRADEDVCLVLKVWSSLGKDARMIGAEIERFVRDELGLDPSNCPDITILDRQVAAGDMPGLYAAADCYVQPSRGEGWGRPIMEAMAAGLPAIATDWGGNTEFMNRFNAFPLEYALAPCDAEAAREAQWFEGQSWAEPCVPHLRHLMRGLFQKPELGREVGARAREEILDRYDRTRGAAQLLDAVQRVLDRKATGG